VNVLAVVAGALLLALAAWDTVLTLLHPTARGPLSYVSNRATWRVTQTISRRVLRGRGLSYAGPLAVVINVLAWVVALWLGFALIYLPFMGSFAFDPSTPFRGRGFGEALYMSGTALTTVGFGDVVATGMALRLATLAEAASGFGILSGAIAYVLSVYPLLSRLRSTGIQMADSGAVELDGATEVVRSAGPSELAAVVRELTENHEHLRRFPVLYYFESGDAEESLSASVRGGAMLLVALRSASPDDVKHAAVYAVVFEGILGRLLDDLEGDFLGGRHTGMDRGASRSERDAARLDAICGVLLARGCLDAGLGALLVRVESVLEDLAEEHGHTARPLFSDDDDDGAGGSTATRAGGG
jgi:hypothetical protein